MSTKSFPIAVVVSVYTGVSFGQLTPFDQIHELSECVLGHPIWTHELADKSLWDRMASILEIQYPKLKELGELVVPQDKSLIKPALEGYLNDAIQLLGNELSVSSGLEERTESPLESLERMAPDKHLITVVIPERDK